MVSPSESTTVGHPKTLARLVVLCEFKRFESAPTSQARERGCSLKTHSLVLFAEIQEGSEQRAARTVVVEGDGVDSVTLDGFSSLVEGGLADIEGGEVVDNMSVSDSVEGIVASLEGRRRIPEGRKKEGARSASTRRTVLAKPSYSRFPELPVSLIRLLSPIESLLGSRSTRRYRVLSGAGGLYVGPARITKTNRARKVSSVQDFRSDIRKKELTLSDLETS